MKLTIDQQIEKDITAEKVEFNQTWLECTAEIYQSDRLIYCVDIDGQVLYNQYEDYVRNNLQQINHIHITTFSRLESINETEISIHEYLNRFIPAVASIADRMYGELSSEMWEEFGTGLQGLQWIVSSFEFLKYLYTFDSLKGVILTTYCAELDQIVTVLDENLSNNNLVEVGDLLQYELLPHLTRFQSGIEH